MLIVNNAHKMWSLGRVYWSKPACYITFLMQAFSVMYSTTDSVIIKMLQDSRQRGTGAKSLSVPEVTDYRNLLYWTPVCIIRLNL